MQEQGPRARRWRLQILGGFRLCDTAGVEVALPTKHDRAILAYLVLSTGRPTRDKLATLIWESRQLEQARHSLTGSLRALRLALGDDEGLMIVPNSDPLECDFSAIDVDALTLRRAARVDADEALERVEALYAGDLLEGLWLRSAGFEEWLLLERQSIRDLAVDALSRLIARREAAGEGDKAIETARRVLDLDELREDVHRKLIRLHLTKGNRRAALKQVEKCESILNSAGVAPEPETARVFAEVRGPVTAPIESSPGTDAHRTLALPTKPSIAVLPFDNLSGDPAQQDLIDGVTEDIITELSRFSSLFVIARNSSFQYRSKAIDTKRVGRDLGVRYIVEGSFRRSNERIRIAAQLVDASSGVHLWAEHYDRNLRDIFEVQDEVSQRVVAMLVIRLEVHELALAKRKPPENIQAYDYWLHGKKCLDLHTAEGFAEARSLFERAITVDPSYARAYSGLAYVYNMAPFYSDWGGAPLEWSHEKAFVFAQRAVSFGDADHVPHLMLGWCQLWRRNYGEAQREFDLALALNPNDADALAYRGFYQIYMGDPDAAVETVRMAIRLNPHRPDWYIAHLVCAYFMARRYDDAILAGDGLRDVWPEYSAWMAALLAQGGRIDEARLRAAAFVANVRRIWTGDPQAGAREYVLWMMNWNPLRRRSDADHLLDGLRKAGLIE